MYLDRRGLVNERHAHHETQPAILAQEETSHSHERAPHDLHFHAFAKERVGVVGKLALDETTYGLDLPVSDWLRASAGSDQADDAGDAQDSQSLTKEETPEAIAGKQWPFDPL